MKLKVKFIKIIHLPFSDLESKSWSYKVKHKEKVIHDGFNTGPFYKTKNEAKEGIINKLNPV